MDTLGLLELISSLLATTEGHEQRVGTRWNRLVYDTHTQLKAVTRTTLYGMIIRLSLPLLLKLMSGM